jgi:hypothetical protein
MYSLFFFSLYVLFCLFIYFFCFGGKKLEEGRTSRLSFPFIFFFNPFWREANFSWEAAKLLPSFHPLDQMKGQD